MSFFDTFCEMLVIFFAIAMGYLANRLKIMGGEMDQKVSKLLLYITVPALSLGSVLARETLPPLREFVSILVIVVIFYGMELLFALVVPRVLGGTPGQKGVWRYGMLFPNVGFIGYPVVVALLGQDALFYAIILALPFNMLSYSLGPLVLAGAVPVIQNGTLLLMGYDEAFDKAERMIIDGGYGHTASIYLDAVNELEKLSKFAATMKTCRIVVNTPSSHGGIGDLYNFNLTPSLTLGCGSWGGNSVSENVGVKHLLNIKTVAERRENMLWFRAPEKVYIKKGCMPLALQELKDVMGKKKAFVVTDSFLYQNGYTKPITDKLNEMNITCTVFSDVEPDPSLLSAQNGAAAMRKFEPDTIIAFGGGSAMDAAKIMWVLYEHPDVDFQDMAMRFSDIRKRIYTFPKMGEKAYFIAIPTSSGTGSEVTPFAVITDQDTGIKYPLADYELMPNMAIVDADNMMSGPKGLTAASGIDAVSHALEAYASVMATDFTDGLALKALQVIFKYLPACYDNGQNEPFAREKVAHAATMAGMAFANAFLGVCHSMAHKLGAFHHIAHGVANALMLEQVIRFNSVDVPTKMGTFPQYDHPHTLERYAEVARFLGFGGKDDAESVENLIDGINDLKKKVGIKETIADYGVTEEAFLATLDEMTEQAFDDQCTGANPRYPLMSEIKQMYLNAFYGNNKDAV